MAFNPLDFLEFSKSLKEAANSEAQYRTILNRAYYSVFGYLRQNINHTFSDGLSVHKELIDYLKKSGVKKEKIIGSKLEFLFGERKKADYDYSIEILDWHCQNVISDAEKIIEIYKK